MGFEPTTPVLDWAKIFRPSADAATEFGRVAI
jgi:hypothetical protein